MKKLLYIFISTANILFCLSCSNNNDNSLEETKNIARSEWDTENIAFTNTQNFYESGSTYQRKEGSSGIIGVFSYSYDMYYPNMSYSEHTNTITFSDTGYFSKTRKGYTSSLQPYNTTDSGTFILYTSKKTSDYFCVKTISEEGHGDNYYFFQVNDTGLILEPYIIIDGDSVEPEYK